MSAPPMSGLTAGGSMFGIATPGAENVAQPSPTESARSPSARATLAQISAAAGNAQRVREVQATKHANCATSRYAVADQDDKKDPKDAKPNFDPKPVQLGGESLIDRLLPHRKKILIAILLGFGVWGVIAIIFHFRDSRRES